MTALLPLPLVYLPGLDGTTLLRRELVDELRRFRPVTLIAYPDDPTLDYRALDGFVRAQLPEGRFAVLGESFSGPIAIKLAHDEPRRVAGLLLLSTFARHPWPRALVHGVPVLDAALCPPVVLDWVMLGAGATDAQRMRLKTVAAALPKEVLQARARAAMSVDVSGFLAATACRLLCVSGSQDWLIQRRSAAHIRALRPDGAYVVLDGAHNLAMTHIPELTREIERFCSSLQQNL